MSKRRPALHREQLAFTFEAPLPARGEADLAGLDRVVASAVSHMLRDDGRSRYEVAGAMSALLDEEVSKAMLDGYAAEARGDFNISVHRLFALVAVTERFDVLDALMRRIGAAVLVGEEIRTAQLGHLDRQIADLKAQKRTLEAATKPITRER